MADYGGGGDYGRHHRRRPRATVQPSSAAGGVPLGQPRIVYRGRLPTNKHSANAKLLTGGTTHYSGDAASRQRTVGGRGDGAAYDDMGRPASKSSYSGGGGGGGGTGKSYASTGSTSRAGGADGGGRGASGIGGRGGGGGGNDKDFLASAGIQLSDRQRQLMERRRQKKPAGGAAGNISKPAAAADGTVSASAAVAGRSNPKSSSSSSNGGGRIKTSRSSNSRTNRSSSGRSPTRSPIRAAGNSRPSLTRGLQSGAGNIGKKSPTRSPIRAGNSRPSLRQSKSTANGTGGSRRSILADLDGNSPKPKAMLPRSSSNNRSSRTLGRSESAGRGTTTLNRSSSGGRAASGAAASSTSTGNAKRSGSVPNQRPKLVRSSSSRRSVLGDIDGNSPKRTGSGTGIGGGGSSKRLSSKSPKRSGSARAAMSRSASRSTLVVHDESTSTLDKEDEETKMDAKMKASSNKTGTEVTERAEMTAIGSKAPQVPKPEVPKGNSYRPAPSLRGSAGLTIQASAAVTTGSKDAKNPRLPTTWSLESAEKTVKEGMAAGSGGGVRAKLIKPLVSPREAAASKSSVMPGVGGLKKTKNKKMEAAKVKVASAAAALPPKVPRAESKCTGGVDEISDKKTMVTAAAAASASTKPPPRGILRESSYTKRGPSTAPRSSSLTTVSAASSLTASGPSVDKLVDSFPTNSSSVATNNVDDDDSSASFDAFMKELKEEVAGDHVELWSGFQSMLGVSPAEMRPLHSDFEAEAVAAGGFNGGSVKSKTKKRLGPQAQETLSSIHRHLLDTGRSEDYGGSTQLVNDRKVAKERARAKKAEESVSSTVGNSPSARTALTKFAGRTPAAPRRPTGSPPRQQVYEQEKSWRQMKQEQSLKVDEEDTTEEIVVVEDGKAPETNPVSQASEVSLPTASPLAPLMAKSEYISADEPSKEPPGESRALSTAPPVMPAPNTPAPKTPAPEPEAPKTNQEPPWLSKLRERQRKLREEQKSEVLSPTSSMPSSGEKDPIEALFGKRTISTCKKRSADDAYEDLKPVEGTPWKVKLRATPAKPKVETGTPWQVKLRATPAKPRDDDKNDAEEAADKVEAVPFAIGLKKTGFFEKKDIRDPYSKRVAEPAEQWNPSEKAAPMSTIKRPDGSYQVPTQSYLSGSQPSYLLQRQPWLKPSELKPVNESKSPGSPSHNLGITFGDTIDLDDLPIDTFGPLVDVTIVELCSSDDEPTSVVIVGKDAVVKATRCGASEGEEEAEEKKGAKPDRATIAWCWHRADIRSLTLNNEATCAELALKRRSRVSLSFESADDCMLFAQAFYKLTTHAHDVEEDADGAKQQSEDKEEDDTGKEYDEEEGQQSLEKPSPKKEDPPEDTSIAQDEAKTPQADNEQSKSSPANLTVDTNTGATTNEAAESIQTGGRVLTEEEEFVLKQYHEGVITANSVAAACSTSSASTESISGADPALGNNSNAVALDPRAALLNAIKGGVQSKLAKFDKLPKEEEEIATKYRKMLSMGVPPEAVRHAMKRDQIDEKIVNVIFNGDEASQMKSVPAAAEDGVASSATDGDTSDLSEEEEEIAAKYRKMLKVSIPREAVKHKMLRDSISEKIRVAVLGPDSDKPKASGLSLTDAEEQIAAQYRKMLKISIPRDAVRNKMMRDNVGVKMIEAVLGKGASAKAEKDVVAVVLTAAEEAVASQYKRMIRFNIPKDAVRHKMMKDNVDARIIIAVVGDENGLMTPHGRKKKKGRGKSLVALHWTPLSPSALEQSVWRTTKKRRLTSACIPEESDVQKLEELFQKKTNKGKKGPGDSATEGDGKSKAKLIDLNRANIIAISLKAFSDFSHKELADTIANLDPDTKIVGERVQFLTGLLPNQTEVAAIKGYKGDDSRLVPAETFFRHLLSVPRLQTKVHVIQTMATFCDSAKETASKFQLLKSVCNQVMESEKLQKVLEMVLHIGNIMNEGTRTGDIDGFKFDSLLKLTQTKSMDGKLTVLDYIVTTFIEKGDRSSLGIAADFPECEVAGRIQIGDLIGDARGLRMGLNKCRTELAAMKTDQSEKRVTRSMASQFTTPSKPADPRASLFAAIKSRREEDVNDKPADDPRRAMLSAIKARSDKTEESIDSSKDESKPEKHEFSPGVARLESFLTEAAADLESLDKERNSAVKACKSLSTYVGESGGEKSATIILSILSTFAKSVETAVQQYDKRKVAEEKKRKAAEKKKGMTADKHYSVAATSGPLKPNGAGTRGDDAGSDNAVADSNSTAVGALKKPQNTVDKKVDDTRSDNASTLDTFKIDTDTDDKKGGESSGGDGVSLVLMVNDMLRQASPKTKKDYAAGVKYKHPHTRQLKHIYEKEERLANTNNEEGSDQSKPTRPIGSSRATQNFASTVNTPTQAAVDPRSELLQSIKKRVVHTNMDTSTCNESSDGTGSDHAKVKENSAPALDPRQAMLAAINSRSSGE